MKRWVFRIVLFLLLGAIINVAVAWGCVLWSNENEEFHDSEDWSAPLPIECPQPNRGVWVRENFGLTDWGVLFDPPSYHKPLMGNVTVFIMAGWPLRSLYAKRDTLEFIDEPLLYIFNNPETFAEGIAIPQNLSNPYNSRCLPTLPLWLGFSVNSTIYAIALGLLLNGPFVLLRWRRTKRGLCRKCAYPIGVSDTCTECGMAVTSRARQ